MSEKHQLEVASKERFKFGHNWSLFLQKVDESRIQLAEDSLKRMLEVDDLNGKRFLDAGSGSGLFSLAARRLGASVHSFDYDAESVECTKELRKRYFPEDPAWVVEEGSVLDKEYLKKLTNYDVVYSWGVLHHTGDMWSAFENIVPFVSNNGSLFISIYNDQGRMSKIWLRVKKAYNFLPSRLRGLVLLPSLVFLWGPSTLRDLAEGRPFHTWKNYAEHSTRGMSAWRDVVDWVGGLPFQVAKPEEIFDWFGERNFTLKKLKTCGGGLGCNEYVFKRNTGM